MKYSDQISEIGYGKYTPAYQPMEVNRRNSY